MAERAIQVGDLVVVIACHCTRARNVLGKIFRVEAVQNSAASVFCTDCHEQDQNALPLAYDGRGWYGYVKRIPPLGELEGERTQEPVRVPAKEHT
mgnify:CR=1 FL=1